MATITEIKVAGYAGKPGDMRPVYDVYVGPRMHYRRDANGVWFKERMDLKGAPSEYRGYLARNYVKLEEPAKIQRLNTEIEKRQQSGIDDSYKGELSGHQR